MLHERSQYKREHTVIQGEVKIYFERSQNSGSLSLVWGIDQEEA